MISGTGLLYILERFPAETLNFVYNEIQVQRERGREVTILSLLPHVHCPREAAPLLPLTTTLRPIGVGLWTRALLHYLLRRPAALAGVLCGLPLADRNGGLRKVLRSFSHAAVGVCAAYVLRSRREHLHAHFAFKAATAALVISRLNGNSYSFTAHGSATVQSEKRYGLCAKIAGARFVVAVSDFNKAVMRRDCPGASGTPIHVNRTGVLLDQFDWRERPPRDPSTGARLLCVATLYPVKNHEGLLAACALLVQRGIDFSLDLVGGGDPGLRRRLEDRAAQPDLAGRIRFLGVVDHGEVAALMAAADLHVLASHSEGVPVAVMEAMAIGTPVVAPRVTGVPELVEDGVSGLLVDPEDPVDIADKLVQALRDPQRTAAMARAARIRIERDYDMRRNAERLAVLIDAELDGGGR